MMSRTFYHLQLLKKSKVYLASAPLQILEHSLALFPARFGELSERINLTFPR